MWKTPEVVERPMFDFSVYQSAETVLAVLDVEGVSYTAAFGVEVISGSSLCGGPGHPGSVGVSHTQYTNENDPRLRYIESQWGGPLYTQQYGRGKRK